MSIIKDPETYGRFDHVILVHGCRHIAELAYGETITKVLPQDELVGEMIRDKLIYYPTVTREPFRNRGRITDLITSGKLFKDVGLPPLSAEHDRVMLCGSPLMLADLRDLLDGMGFVEGSQTDPGRYVIEKAFVEK
jgi:ferredoxin--NADP+ reductase